MKRIVLPFVLVTTAAWLAGLFIFPPGYSTRAVSHEFFYLSGTLAWGLMAIALVIAARPAWLERVAGEPLDRLYGHHKTLGLWAIGLSVLHYFGKTVGGTVVSVVSLFGIEAAQVGRPVIDQTGMNALELFWSALRPVAVTSSIWATAFMVLLGVLALSKRIKYPAWLTAHRLFAVVFLVLSLHSVRLMDTTDFVSPFGWINLVVTVVGVWASVVILVKGAGASKSVPATVRAAEHAGGVTILTVEPAKTFAAAPGQFAFLKVSGHEKHPFTIAGRTPEGGGRDRLRGQGARGLHGGLVGDGEARRRRRGRRPLGRAHARERRSQSGLGRGRNRHRPLPRLARKRTRRCRAGRHHAPLVREVEDRRAAPRARRSVGEGCRCGAPDLRERGRTAPP